MSPADELRALLDGPVCSAMPAQDRDILIANALEEAISDSDALEAARTEKANAIEQLDDLKNKIDKLATVDRFKGVPVKKHLLEHIEMLHKRLSEIEELCE